MSIWLGILLYVLVGFFIGSIATAKFILNDNLVDQWVERPDLVQKIDIFSDPAPWFFGIGAGFLWPLTLVTAPAVGLVRWYVRRKANPMSALAELNREAVPSPQPQQPGFTTPIWPTNIFPSSGSGGNWTNSYAQQPQTPKYTVTSGTSTDGS